MLLSEPACLCHDGAREATYPSYMNWIDLVIIGLVILAALRGHRAGALRQIGSFVGFVVGFFVGTQFAPSLASSITHATWRPALALGLVIVAAFAASTLGQLVGSIASRSLEALHLGLVDRVAGVAVGVVGALVVCWMVAGLLGSTAWGSLAGEIQNSFVLRALNAVLPPVPAVESRVQALFRNADFPSIFASIVAPTLPSSGPPTHLGPLVRSLGSPLSVQKVLASGGCANVHEGTGFFVAPHEVVTNAHVVAGASTITVGGARAIVALFDPRQDLAVLRVPSLAEPPLRFLRTTPEAGTPAHVVGFPLDATRTGAPAVIRGELSGQGRDIYNRGLLTRTVLVVDAQVQPGNSGSPVLVGPFVAGVIVSKSISQPETAYAIPDRFVRYDLARTPANAHVSTHSCLP